MTATVVLPQSVRTKAVTLVNADGTALKDFFTADGLLNQVKAISITSDDTSNRVVQFWATIGGTDYLLFSIVVPTLAGTDGVVAAVSVLSSAFVAAAIFDAVGNKVLPLDTGIVLRVKAPVAVTAAKTITITALVDKY